MTYLNADARSKVMREGVLSALVGLVVPGVVLTGCSLRPVDTQVRWNFDEECETHDIVEWKVTYTKRDSFGESYPCTDTGDYVSDVFRIHEGHYSVAVEALDSMGQVLATRTTDGEVIAEVDVFYFDIGAFTVADFSVP